MKANILSINGFESTLLHSFDCKNASSCKLAAERLVNDQFYYDGKLGRYSLYRSVRNNYLLQITLR